MRSMSKKKKEPVSQEDTLKLILEALKTLIEIQKQRAEFEVGHEIKL